MTEQTPWLDEEDLVQPFFFDDIAVRGAIVRLSNSIQTVLSTQDYKTPLISVLGESAAATSLIAHSLKFTGRLTLQLRGPGPLSMLVMQSREDLKLRGMALGDGVSEHLGFGELAAGAQCSVAVDSDNARERYQGIVEVQPASLTDSLLHFFSTSIQVPTALVLYTDSRGAGGFLLQTLAGSDKVSESDDWMRLKLMLSTISLEDFRNNSAVGLLRKVFAEDDLRLPDARPVNFHCECSRAKAARAIEMLGSEDARQAVKDQGRLSVSCEYCGRSRDFDTVDVAGIFAAADQPGSSGPH
ncbi:MAG: Hsp33 family molecular chaperone HslO [Pseudomonadota bacterium]